MTSVSACDDLDHESLQAMFPSALATVARGLDALRQDVPVAPSSLAALVRLASDFDDWFRSRLGASLDVARSAGEIEEYGSIVSWSGGGYPGSTITVTGETSGCGRGCCPPKSCQASIPWDWVAMPPPTLKAFLAARKESKALEEDLPAEHGVATPPRSRL